MYYYEVWPAEQSYHKNNPLTYASESKLTRGTVVEVPVKNKSALAFINSSVAKPAFAVKQLSRITPYVLPKHILELFVWMLSYYPAPSGQLAALFLPKELPKKLPEAPVSTDTISSSEKFPPLTQAQEKVFSTLLTVKDTALLHGDTGTGKTRIYAELCQKAIEKNQSVVILTPEIGLTPQLAEYFYWQYGSRVLVNHSGLTAAQRRTLWIKVANASEPHIIIGPRSSLFLPLKNIGLVVVDEAHDSSYKQEQSPHYHATRVAAKLAKLHDCLCLMGTATPLIDDYYRLKKHGSQILRLRDAVHRDIKPAEITIVKRSDKDEFTQSTLCSNTLIREIAAVKKRGLTSLLFLNRRGTARQVICQQCGWIASCPNCDIPLTFHHDQHILRCHTCDHRRRVPLDCEDCHSSELLFKVAGTKALEQELKRLFPSFSIKKFDSDDSQDAQLHKQYEAIKNGTYDLIVGTQIIAKGLDLHNLGVVGVPYADTSLYMPDYTADEQTFQLLTQVVGRVGRSNQSTKVVIQSYQPDHPALVCAVNKDWESFYKQQLLERKKFNYPPYTYLLKLTISRKTDRGAENAAHKLYESLKNTRDVTVLPPAPRFYHKARGSYHWQLVVKSPRRQNLQSIASSLPSGWRYDIDPVSLL